MQTGVVFLWLFGLLTAAPPEQAARQAQRAGHLAQAAVLLECLRDRPRRKRERWPHWNAERIRVGYLAAHIALQRKHPLDAVYWLKPLVKQPSQIRDYLAYLLAQAYLDAGVPNQAIPLYLHILKEHESHWRQRVRRKLLKAYQMAGRWEERGDLLKKVLWSPVAFGGRRKVLWQMTDAYIKAGKTKKVQQWLRHIPLRYPLTDEANAAQRAALTTPSSKTFRKVSEWSQSEVIWRYYNMAHSHPTQALTELQAWQAKLKVTNQAERLLEAQLRMLQARAYLRQRMYGKVIPLTEALTKSNYPKDVRRRAVYLLGEGYIGDAQFKKGWKFLHAYAEREPEQRTARWASRWAARLAMLAQDYKQARRLFWEYLKIYPDMKPKKRLQTQWFRAWCLFRMGDYRKALQAFRALARKTRNSSMNRRIQYWTGRLHERSGRWDKARDIYAKLVRYTALTYYGILAKRRLYLLEIQIRQQAQEYTCQRATTFVTADLHKALAQHIEASKPTKKEKKSKRTRKPKKKQRKKSKRKKSKGRTKSSKKPKLPKPQLMRVPLKNPMWKKKFAAPWQEGWVDMMQLEENQGSAFRSQLDETMRENVHTTIKKSGQVVPFPSLPDYCKRRNTRYCKRARRAEILAGMGFTKAAVDELFRGRWVMKRPRQRLLHTIRWFRSVGAHHEAIRMTYWLSNWGKDFKPDEYFRLRYPPAHASLLFKHTKAPKVSLAFAWAIMREESLFFQNTYSWAAARGLMQIIPRTAFRIAKIIGLSQFSLPKLYAPDTNIRMGCWYLGQLLTKFESNIQLAAAAYNAGPHRVVAWLQDRSNLAADEFTEEIPFDETRLYVRRVLRSFTVYNYLYRGSLPQPLSTVAVKVKDNINF